MPRTTIPEDKINLRLIMVSGKTKDYLFKPTDSAGDIAQFIFDNWPEGEKFFKFNLRHVRISCSLVKQFFDILSKLSHF